MKVEYVSGHFHDCRPPCWYTKSQAEFYRDLNKLKLLGLIRRKHGCFWLNSRRNGVKTDKNHRYHFTQLEVTSFNELKKCFETLAITNNLDSQLFAIVAKKKKIKTKSYYSKTAKLDKSKINKALKLYRDGCRLNTDHFAATRMSCIKAGELLGKSAFVGAKKLRELIDERVIKRITSLKHYKTCQTQMEVLDNIATAHRCGIVLIPRGMKLYTKHVTVMRTDTTVCGAVNVSNKIAKMKKERKEKYGI